MPNVKNLANRIVTPFLWLGSQLSRVRHALFWAGMAVGGVFLLGDGWAYFSHYGEPTRLAEFWGAPAAQAAHPLQSLWFAFLNGWAFVTVPLATLAAVAVLYVVGNLAASAWHHLARGLGALSRKTEAERRHIILCIDGTWNYSTRADAAGNPTTTNVFKIFDLLEGDEDPLQAYKLGATRYKSHPPGGEPAALRQIGLYYQGVGNRAAHTPLGIVLGGVFGLGAARIRKLAYRDLVRYFRNPEFDRITIIGFSRGAAIARWLAGYIEEHGIPALGLADVTGLRHVARWLGVPRHRARVSFLGVFDTVASFGLPKNVLGIPFQRIDLFKDFRVSACVDQATHLVSIDERRDSFLPTLMEPDPASPDRIHEVWFAGVHSDVGGGFADTGLSDITLDYMVRRLRNVMKDKGVSVEIAEPSEVPGFEMNPAKGGPVEESPIYTLVSREIPIGARVHRSVVKRMKTASLLYYPSNVLASARRTDDTKSAVLRVLGQVEPDQELANIGPAFEDAYRMHLAD